MLRLIKRTVLAASAAVATPVLLFCALVAWPDPLFAFSLGTGKIVVASDRPIPPAGGKRLLRDCERLLERSPLKVGVQETDRNGLCAFSETGTMKVYRYLTGKDNAAFCHRATQALNNGWQLYGQPTRPGDH